MRIRAAADAEQLLGTYLRTVEHRAFGVTARFVLPRFLFHLRQQRIRDLRAVHEADVVGFARHLQQVEGRRGPLSMSTQRTFFTAVRSFFSFLEQQRAILMNPARNIRFPKVHALPRGVPTEAQVRRLLRTPSSGTLYGKRDRAILETLYGSGIRLGECARLDVHDLSLQDMTLLIRNGKGKKDRVVPITGRAADALTVYVQDVRARFDEGGGEAALFLSSKGGRRLARQAIVDLVARHRKTAQLPRLSAHSLRHACATHLLRRGADVRHVQAILGHKRIETTALYTRVEVGDLREVLARAHPRERAWSRTK